MTIDYSRFTNKSRNAILKAVSLTKQCQYAAIEPQVMMVAVLQEGNDMVPFLLNQMEVDKTEFFTAVSNSMRSLGHAQIIDPDFSTSLQEVFQESIAIAQQDRTNVVALEYIFWAFAKVNNPIKDIMSQFGITPAKVELAVNVFRHGDENEDLQNDPDEENLPNLHRYGSNLIKLAEDGDIEPVIGRDEEIRRILQIISRKTKNNPILVGEPGTGKTAIVEGLAHRIIRGDIPQELRGLKLYTLDIASLIAGAQMQGADPGGQLDGQLLAVRPERPCEQLVLSGHCLRRPAAGCTPEGPAALRLHQVPPRDPDGGAGGGGLCAVGRRLVCGGPPGRAHSL